MTLWGVNRSSPSFSSVLCSPQKEHEGRKLTWIYQHCKGELKTLYTKKPHFLEVRRFVMRNEEGKKQRPVLTSGCCLNSTHSYTQANTVQIVALLQFNDSSALTLDDIASGSGLTDASGKPDTVCQVVFSKRTKTTRFFSQLAHTLTPLAVALKIFLRNHLTSI